MRSPVRPASGPALTRAASITHQHLLAILNTESHRRTESGTVRLLDLGCGDGRLLAYLGATLPLLNPHVRFELHGLEVYDCDVQPPEFLATTRRLLADQLPAEDWESRLVSVSASDPWPYENEHFDVVISNQVLEHAKDHDFLFGQLVRTLKWGGWSVHLFPLMHCLFESHLHLPFVHRIRNFDTLRAYIRMLSRLGLGKYPAHHNATGIGVEDFAERHADYIHSLTNYLTYGEAIRFAKRNGLRASFRYTGQFYTSKLRSLLGRPAVYEYSADRSAYGDWLAVMILRYVSSVTLFLERQQTYKKAGRDHDARHLY